MGTDTQATPPAVLGLDAGGTSTRAAVFTQTGQVLGLGRGPGANPNSSSAAIDASLAAAIRAALDVADSPNPQIVACVAGVAGAGHARSGEIRAGLDSALAACGVDVAAVQLVPDPVVAFAAGSPDPDGIVLVAGTGAVAFRLEDFSETARSDGLGWMLGDVGGGIWLGIRGLRAAAAALDGRGPHTTLSDAALRFASDAGASTGVPTQDLVYLTSASSPSQLGAFAPAVTKAAGSGDRVAQCIVDDAIAGLRRTLGALRAHEDDPIVLAGSILTSPGPIADQLRAGLERVFVAREPIIGATRLAARLAGWELPPLPALQSSFADWIGTAAA